MTAPFGPPNEPPPPDPPQPSGAMQPKYLIGLGLAAAVILIAAVIVLVARSGNGEVAVGDRTSTTLAESAPTTSPIPLPATTTTSSTTTSTSTTSTTTSTSLPPLAPVANAGDDLAVDASGDVTMTAVDLSEPNQSIVWRQVDGPDVTDGAGRLRGNDAQFSAPDSPTTLLFELVVTGRGGEMVTDDLRIDVYEDADRAIFVDGLDGDDADDGSRERPFRSLVRALDFTRGSSADIYLRTVDGVYSSGTSLLDRGSSLYGGYDGDWLRDVRRPTAISGDDAGIAVFDAERSVISAVDIVGPDLDSGDPSYGLVAAGIGRLEIDHATISAGSSTGASIGVKTEAVGTLVVADVTIRGGVAGDGSAGSSGTPGESVAAAGSSAPAPPTPGAPGGNGGAGGEGGAGLERGDDGEGVGGGAGGEPRENGAGGDGGSGGAGGVGGEGGTVDEARPERAGSGRSGEPGAEASGGAGGGGGGGLILHEGGGGGGGGGGGAGGEPGQGGTGGHLSVGLWLVDTDDVIIASSTIEGGVAGSGGAGGSGAPGGDGGGGGGGADGVSTFVDTAGSGGGGGGGGSGGEGGSGGGGAGGRSVGLLTSDRGAIEVSDSVIRGGQGGDGGVGGAGGLPGNPGSGGAGTVGGGGSTGLRADGARSAAGSPAVGGDSVGWWDLGGWSRTIIDSTITGGSPGRGGGPEGRSAAALDTIF